MGHKIAIDRVFFHELGHYFAFRIAEIDNKLFKIERFTLTPRTVAGYFDGFITPLNPTRSPEKPRDAVRVWDSYYIMNQFYGIIFQLRFGDEDFELNNLVIDKYARSDYSNVLGHEIDYRISSDKLIAFFNDHLSLLKKNEFSSIENLDINSLLLVEEKRIEVDLLNLEVLTRQTIREFTPIFESCRAKLLKMMD